MVEPPRPTVRSCRPRRSTPPRSTTRTRSTWKRRPSCDPRGTATGRAHGAMIDFGFDKIALIGAVALIVIGPEKLPRVARTVGMLLGKAQRYVADVKAEVNRSIELEELQKMKSQFETAARDVHDSVHKEFGDARTAIEDSARGGDDGHVSVMKPYEAPHWHSAGAQPF